MFQLTDDPQFVRNQQFHDACRVGDKETALRLLDENPKDTYLIDVTRSDKPAILEAAYGQHWELTAELIKRGVDLNVKNLHGYSPLHVFAEHGQDELLRLACQNAAYINRKNNKGESPLYFACKFDKEATCETIFSLGGEVNALTKALDSPMHWAARNGNSSLAAKLIARGAHAHGENDMGETPISLAKTDDMRAELERASLMRTVEDAESTRKAEIAANPDAASQAEEPKPKRRILKA
jgi:ankyrin repeat protein